MQGASGRLGVRAFPLKGPEEGFLRMEVTGCK